MMFRYDQDAKEFFDKADSIKTNYSKIEVFDRKNIANALSAILDKIS
jgi:hypothetical protein